jgi:hypothetical protein
VWMTPFKVVLSSMALLRQSYGGPTVSAANAFREPKGFG